MPSKPPKPKPAKPHAKPKPKPKAKPRAKAPAGERKRRERAEYPERLHPSERVRAQWARRGRETGERGYSQRWAAFWKRVVLATVEAQNAQHVAWKVTDLHLVAEYVRRCRLAELHVEEAEAEPYCTNTDTGVVRAHPGWERSLAEAREARAIADQLGLPPAVRRSAGIDVPKIDRPKGSGEEPEPGGGWVDNQVGPDGEPL